MNPDRNPQEVDRLTWVLFVAGALFLALFAVGAAQLILAPLPRPKPPVEMEAAPSGGRDPGILIPADVRPAQPQEPEPVLRWQTLPRAYAGQALPEEPEPELEPGKGAER